MSAQLAYQIQPEEQHDTEVIYLVIPPTVAPMYAPRPYSLAESLALFGMELRCRMQSLTDSGLALYGALALTACVGYSLYTLKSAAGIDLFPTQHIESFIPINGFNRW
ncbi:MAG: hypothetical protein WCK51_15560 [Armatimonadota bacterium]